MAEEVHAISFALKIKSSLMMYPFQGLEAN